MFVRHMFAGVNSPLGFYSRFDSIADDAKCIRKIYLKGGPGTGKSTLIKKIASIASEDGYDCEIFHCSSDSESADGVYLPQLKTAVVDATAPHNADPAYPGLTGVTWDAAEYIDREKLLMHRNKIIYYAEKKQAAFRRAYNYLSAAAPIFNDIRETVRKRMDPRCISIESERIIKKLFGNLDSSRDGNVRKLFLSAVCPEGFVNFAESVFSGCDVVAVKGCWGPPELVERIMRAAVSKGLDVEAFYCPMRPKDKVEHIVIPEIKMAFTTYNYYHHYSSGEVIDLEDYLNEHTEDLEEACIMAEDLLKKAVTSMAAAREAHSFLEGFYTPAMDFERFNQKANHLIKSIFE